MKGLAIDDQLLKADEEVILEDLIVVAHEERQKGRAADGRKNEGRHRRPSAAAGHEAAVLMPRS